MKYIPILFSTPMVIANLNGSKTQTRRTKGLEQLNENPDEWVFDRRVGNQFVFFSKYDKNKQVFITPKVLEDYILWCRETWQHTKCLNLNWQDENYGYVYRADDQPWEDYEGWTWKPSIFMPKEACRIFLKVTNVRVQRLHDISEEDAIAEGIECLWQDDTGEISVYRNYMATEKDFENDPWAGVADTPQHSFFTLWESINGKESLDSNPWLWVYNFEKIEKPEGWPKI